MGQQGFWDFETRHQKLEAKKDLLVCLDEMIPWDEFRSILERVYAARHHPPLGGQDSRPHPGGCGR
ncbi:MAG: hypothetical protein AAGA83_10060, partial [Cyanobacteria bacterium P01_F01_bin.116]